MQWGARFLLGSPGQFGKGRQRPHNEFNGALRPYGGSKTRQKNLQRNNWSPKSKATISVQAVNTPIRLALGSLAVTHPSAEPLPGFIIGGNPERGVRRQTINFK